MRHIKSVLSAGLLGLGLLCGAGAQAQSNYQTFQLTMDCTDCAQQSDVTSYPVHAELTLRDYTLGYGLWFDNFVSFVYQGSNLVAPYSVTLNGDDGNPLTTDYALLNDSFGSYIWGSVTNPGGGNDLSLGFAIDWANGTGYHFSTSADGSWSTCAPNADGGIFGNVCNMPIFNVSDYGTGATYSLAAVPEPEQALLLGAGLLLIGGAVRRQRRG